MAVVAAVSSIIQNYLDPNGNHPDPVEFAGRLVVLTGTATNGASDSSGSSYHLANLPSDCILDTGTAFWVHDWGFATVNLGTDTDTTALMTVLKSAGDTVEPIVFGDNDGLRLWEVLGLAADPGGLIPIYAWASAGATGAGSIKFSIRYLYH